MPDTVPALLHGFGDWPKDERALLRKTMGSCKLNERETESMSGATPDVRVDSFECGLERIYELQMLQSMRQRRVMRVNEAIVVSCWVDATDEG